jgi:hypothetical protein
LRQVDGFAVKHDLEDILPMLQKGALVAQDPENYEDLADLNDEEKAVLKDEIDHKWSHPRALYLTVILCSIGAATQGWDQTGSNAANLSFPTEFGIVNEPWIEGVVNGAPYLTAACITSWLSDPINHYLGRRGTIFLAGIFGIISPIGSACTQNWQQLFVCRLLLGVCIGLKEVTVSIFSLYIFFFFLGLANYSIQSRPQYLLLRIHLQEFEVLWLCLGNCGLLLVSLWDFVQT